MSTYRKFDPDVVLREIENQGAAVAKVAKAAKVLQPKQTTLAALAALAGWNPQGETQGVSLPPQLNGAGLRDCYEERAAICQSNGREDRARAETRAWNAVAAIWHRQHGQRSPAGICAGCSRALGGAEVITLPHGDRVHVGTGEQVFQCLLLHGRHWKGTAAAALKALGIPVPASEEDLGA